MRCFYVGCLSVCLVSFLPCFFIFACYFFLPAFPKNETDGRGGKGVIALKLRKKLDDTLACFRIVGADDEIMLSTTQVRKDIRRDMDRLVDYCSAVSKTGRSGGSGIQYLNGDAIFNFGGSNSTHETLLTFHYLRDTQKNLKGGALFFSFWSGSEAGSNTHRRLTSFPSFFFFFSPSMNCPCLLSVCLSGESCFCFSRLIYLFVCLFACLDACPHACMSMLSFSCHVLLYDVSYW